LKFSLLSILISFLFSIIELILEPMKKKIAHTHNKYVRILQGFSLGNEKKIGEYRS
jgi:hypothetical protein